MRKSGRKKDIFLHPFVALSLQLFASGTNETPMSFFASLAFLIASFRFQVFDSKRKNVIKYLEV